MPRCCWIESLAAQLLKLILIKVLNIDREEFLQVPMDYVPKTLYKMPLKISLRIKNA